MEPGSPASDLQSKYTKLASEYAKMRSQLAVVKKAIVEEQNKNADLADLLKTKDTQMRKSEAEMESLVFRNQQLTKRVGILQDEAERQQRSGKKGHHNQHDTAGEVSSVFTEELQAKIAENARLHATLSDVDQRYAVKIDALESRIEELESEARKKNFEERNEDSKLKDLINGLKADKSELMIQMEQMKKEAIDQADRITVLQVQLESAKSADAPNVSDDRKKLAQNFNHRFPLSATEAQAQTVELLSQVGEVLQDLIASLSDFHTYWEHRLKDTTQSEAMSESARNLSRLLLQNVKYLKPIEQAYQQILADVLNNSSSENRSTVLHKNFSEFSDKIRDYVYYASEIEPLMIGCLEQESNSYSCTPRQRQKNEELQNSIKNFVNALVRLSEAVEAGKDEEPEALIEWVEILNVSISQLHQQAFELAQIYISKSSDENQLPTVTDQLKNTNQCIGTALSNLGGCMNTLSCVLSDNLRRIRLIIEHKDTPLAEDKPDSSAMTSASTVSSEASAAAAAELDSITNDMKLLQEEKMNLMERIEVLEKELKSSEQDKEHWKLEFQLLKMKWEKENSGDEVSNSEENLTKPFEERINELVSEKMQADSKATAFSLENLSLLQRMKNADARKTKAEKDVEDAKVELAGLREEMKTTATNYEMQLSMMSEHLANMNDKLSSQAEEISNLKYDLNNKGKKKK